MTELRDAAARARKQPRDCRATRYRVVAGAIPHWLVSPSSNSTKLHVPDPDAEGDDTPVCQTATGTKGGPSDEWIDKPVTAYPAGYHPVCRHCLNDLAP